MSAHILYSNQGKISEKLENSPKHISELLEVFIEGYNFEEKYGIFNS